MDRNELLKYIRQAGYRSYQEIKAQFSDFDDELLSMNLTYLVDKNYIKQIPYRAGAEAGILYVVHQNCAE